MENDFSKLSKTNVNVMCWLTDGMVDTTISINKRTVYSQLEQLSFYKDLIELLEIMNVSSFNLNIYGNKETISIQLSVSVLKERVNSIKDVNGLLIKNIKKFLKIK